jgi:uncharacterized protein (TIGR03382 family)
VPYFIDADGTRCAMAHLMELGGAGALVAEVAGTNNNAYVAELAADDRFLAWLDAAGLTVEEAARIQPSYTFGLCAAPKLCVCLGKDPEAVVVWEGTVVVEAGPTKVRIDAVHGDALPVELGAVVPIPRAGHIGARLLGVATFAPEGQSQPQPDGGPEIWYDAITSVGDDGIIGPDCFWPINGYEPLSVGFVTPSEAAHLIVSPRSVCEAELAKIDACWARSDCATGGCSPDALERAARASLDAAAADALPASPPAASPVASAAEPGGCQSSGAAPTSMGILVAIIGALAVRRRRQA